MALLGLAALLIFLMVSAYLPLLWGDALAPLQVADLSAWPTWAAAAAGVLLYEFVDYVCHRAMHTFAPLWRAVHQMHHERGVHRDNCADLPMVDMLFGTFRKPPRHADETGFWRGASMRVADLQLARDVSRRPRDRLNLRKESP